VPGATTRAGRSSGGAPRATCPSRWRAPIGPVDARDGWQPGASNRARLQSCRAVAPAGPEFGAASRRTTDPTASSPQVAGRSPPARGRWRSPARSLLGRRQVTSSSGWAAGGRPWRRPSTGCGTCPGRGQGIDQRLAGGGPPDRRRSRSAPHPSGTSNPGGVGARPARCRADQAASHWAPRDARSVGHDAEPGRRASPPQRKVRTPIRGAVAPPHAPGVDLTSPRPGPGGSLARESSSAGFHWGAFSCPWKSGVCAALGLRGA